MTVPVTTRRETAIGNGIAKQFNFHFRLFDTSQIKTFAGDGTTEEQVTSGITITLNDTQDINPGGTVTFAVAPQAGVKLAFVSAIPSDQSMVFTNQGGFKPEVLNSALDKITSLIQQVEESSARTVKLAATDTQSPDELRNTLLLAKAEAEKLLRSQEAIDRLYISAANIDTVAPHSASIDTVAPHVVNIGTVAPHVGNIDVVAPHVANIDAVAPHGNQIDAVAPHAGSVSVVAPHITAINSVAGSIIPVRDVASELLAVHDISINLETVRNAFLHLPELKEAYNFAKDANTYADIAKAWAEEAPTSPIATSDGVDIETSDGTQIVTRTQLDTVGGGESAKTWAAEAKSRAESALGSANSASSSAANASTSASRAGASEVRASASAEQAGNSATKAATAANTSENHERNAGTYSDSANRAATLAWQAADAAILAEDIAIDASKSAANAYMYSRNSENSSVSSADEARKSMAWAEGSDPDSVTTNAGLGIQTSDGRDLTTRSEVEVLGGEHSAKEWAKIAHTDVSAERAARESADGEIWNKISEIELFKFPNATIIGAPKIQYGQASGFTNTDFLKFPFIVDFKGYPFRIEFSFTTGSDVTTQQNIFDSEFGLAFAILNGQFDLAISTNGVSWLAAVLGAHAVRVNTTYYCRIAWSGTRYTLEYSFDKQTWFTDITVESSLQPSPKPIFIGGADSIFGSTGHSFKGSINLNDAHLYIGEQATPVWSGMDSAGISSRADVSLGNIDAAGEQKIREIAGISSVLAELEAIKVSLQTCLTINNGGNNAS